MIKRTGLFALALLLLAGCDSNDDDSAELLRGTWGLTDYNVSPGFPSDLEMDDYKAWFYEIVSNRPVVGSKGGNGFNVSMTCNEFIGTYSTSGSREINLDLEIATYVGCFTDFEETFAALTDEVTGYHIQGDRLTLIFEGRPGESLVFERVLDIES